MPELKLIAKLDLDKRNFDRGVNQASDGAGKFGDAFSKKIGKGFTGGAVAATLLSVGQQAIESASGVEELARMLKITTEEAHRLQLEEKLGSGVGSGSILFNDRDLENLRVVERIFIKVKDMAVTAAAKVAFFASTWGFIVSLAKATGFVSSEPTRGESERDRRLREVQAAAEAHRQEQEEILKLEKESATLDRQTRLAKMTEGQRFNELLKERRVLQQNLIGTDPDDIGTLMMKKRLSEVNLAIAQKGGHDLSSPFKSPLPGAFVGGFNPTANIGRDALAELRKVLKELQRGITVRDVLP